MPLLVFVLLAGRVPIRLVLGGKAMQITRGDDQPCLFVGIDHCGTNACLIHGSDHSIIIFFDICLAQETWAICIRIKENGVSRTRVPPESLAKLLVLILQCPSEFFIQRNFACFLPGLAGRPFGFFSYATCHNYVSQMPDHTIIGLCLELLKPGLGPFSSGNRRAGFSGENWWVPNPTLPLNLLSGLEFSKTVRLLSVCSCSLTSP